MVVSKQERPVSEKSANLFFVELPSSVVFMLGYMI